MSKVTSEYLPSVNEVAGSIFTVVRVSLFTGVGGPPPPTWDLTVRGHPPQLNFGSLVRCKFLSYSLGYFTKSVTLILKHVF